MGIGQSWLQCQSSLSDLPPVPIWHQSASISATGARECGEGGENERVTQKSRTVVQTTSKPASPAEVAGRLQAIPLAILTYRYPFFGIPIWLSESVNIVAFGPTRPSVALPSSPRRDQSCPHRARTTSACTYNKSHQLWANFLKWGETPSRHRFNPDSNHVDTSPRSLGRTSVHQRPGHTNSPQSSLFSPTGSSHDRSGSPPSNECRTGSMSSFSSSFVFVVSLLSCLAVYLLVFPSHSADHSSWEMGFF